MMKKITFLFLFLLTVSIGYSQTSNYCSTEVTHLNSTDPAFAATAINLTIVNTGAATMKVTAANADITFLALEGSIIGAPNKSTMDTSVPGEISITLSWVTAAPVNVTFQYIQWEITGVPGRYQIENATTPFAGDCTIIPPAEDATLSNLTIDGTSVTGFSPGVLTYNIELPFGTTAVPAVLGTPTQGTSTAVTTAAGSLPGTSTVLVTAQDNNFTKTYTLNFTVSTTPPVSLPFDFSSANQEFIGVGGATASLTTDPDDVNNDVLQIVGPAADWDNSEIAFTTPVDLSNSATNSISFKIRTAGDYGSRRHLFKFLGGTAGGTDIELFFTLDAGTGWQTISLDADDAPQFNAVAAKFQKLLIFTDAGQDNGNTGTYFFDDISAPEAAPVDNLPPTAFTATAGNIGAYVVELLLNATDETSATITYDIAYDDAGGNPQTAQTTGDSGIQKSFVISGLTPETAYSFDVSASDASGNNATNNAITVAATTVADTSTACAGFSSEAAQGAFSTGFNYTVETLAGGTAGNTTVKYTIEILDTDKAGLAAARLHLEGENVYINMTDLGNQTWEGTLTSLTDGDVISYAGIWNYAGAGTVETKFLVYTVGDDCGTLSIKDFEIEGLMAYPNPTNSKWTISTKDQEIQAIDVYNVLGKRVLSLKPNTLSVNVDASGLAPGVYISTITTEKGTSSRKLIKN